MEKLWATLTGIAFGGILIALGVSVGYSMQKPEEASAIIAANSAMPKPYLPQATKTIQVPGATKTITRVKQVTKVQKVRVASKVLTCPAGATEDSCYPDYIGKGRWVLRTGEAPSKSLPKATKKAPGATIAGVCRHPSITKGMLADCNKLASRPAISVPGKYAHPNGRVLVKECTDQYKGQELATCLK